MQLGGLYHGGTALLRFCQEHCWSNIVNNIRSFLWLRETLGAECECVRVYGVSERVCMFKRTRLSQQRFEKAECFKNVIRGQIRVVYVIENKICVQIHQLVDKKIKNVLDSIGLDRNVYGGCNGMAHHLLAREVSFVSDTRETARLPSRR